MNPVESGTADTPVDPRPPVWVGHITLPTPEIPTTLEFMVQLGMRPIADGEDFAVLELRGGTHLVLLRSDDAATGPAGFDLMVEDIHATHAQLRGMGMNPSELESGRIHTSFRVSTPAGHSIVFNSTHVSDQPV
jgi:catechol 2,3-dioxygenase-like lactoylglutathione lyase family enzyme